MTPRRSPKAKRFFSLYCALCLVLAFMVFAWGTNYKLSLYNVGHESSPAKVCTRGSDAAKTALDHAADGRSIGQIPLSVAVLFPLFQPPLVGRIHRSPLQPLGDLSPLRQAPTLYLRPPPYDPRSLT